MDATLPAIFDASVAMVNGKELTPLMRQYQDIKNTYPNEIVFFQVGDFYELFFEDAKRVSAFLGITLTARGTYQGQPIPLCGVPVHTKDHYIEKLVKAGYHVAICDQLEPPRPGTVVKRGVTMVLTPGTLTDTRLLDAKNPSYLFTCAPMDNEWALLFGELLTAQLFITTIKAGDVRLLESELVKFFPDEIVLPPQGKHLQGLLKQMGYDTTLFATEQSYEENMGVFEQWLAHHCVIPVHNTILTSQSMRIALYYFYAYMQRNQIGALEQMHTVYHYQSEDFLTLDAATQANLELVKNIHGTHKNTLFSVIDRAATPMGSRLIKKWLLRPLMNVVAIQQRQQVINGLLCQVSLMQQLTDILSSIGDFERIVGRIALQRSVFSDLLQLLDIVRLLPVVQDIIIQLSNTMLSDLVLGHIDSFSDLCILLQSALQTDATVAGYIKRGYSEHLDYLRNVGDKGSSMLLAMEEQEQKKTGINSLKIRYNNVHGYYIEVTKANMHLVPDYYVRQQTLAGRERFITPDLQRLAYEITTARTQIDQLEKELLEKLQAMVRQYVGRLRRCSYAIAQMDALLGLARTAYTYQYVCPTINDDYSLIIMQGRHPVVEQSSDRPFIPNDTTLTLQQLIWIITGPNMGGKSTYLRQVAHIVILAQIGSYVPAQEVHIGLIDRIFTRIGSGDDVARGKSTFLVEMEETAAICMRSTERSLVILDEVGRGTSTFDGMAIAQAVVEYLYQVVKVKTLFATHYHELTDLQNHLTGVVNYYAKSIKTDQGMLFLYKIQPGVGDGSFGIEVARMAQLPQSIIDRAHTILVNLHNEKNHQAPDVAKASALTLSDEVNSSLVVAERIRGIVMNIDFNHLTPKKAFDVMWHIRDIVE